MTHPQIKRGDQLVLASHNQGKLAEFQALFAASGVVIKSAAAFDLPEPDEDADSFKGNARIKALAAAQATGLPALADDSGFCVASLNGQPGIYSARWGGAHRDFNIAMRRVHDEMGAATDKRAAFVTVLCLAWPDGQTYFVEGRCDGQVAWPPHGENGHGYDPIFIPEGETRRFAEMTDAEKNAISHRGRALRQLMDIFVAPDA